MDLPALLKQSLPNVRIIFVTDHLEYAVDAFELSVFRYVPKSELDSRLPRAVLDAARLIELENEGSYVVQDSRRLEKIPHRLICWIQRDSGKNCTIHTTYGETSIRKPLKEVYRELDSQSFIFADRGTVVNLLHLSKIQDDAACMKDGQQLPISRSRLASVKQALNEFWGDRL